MRRGSSFSKGIMALFALAALMTGMLRYAQPPQRPAADLPPTFPAKVVRVDDGDSMTVLVSGREVRLRLQGIDCPERGQPFANAARRFTRQQCSGKRVTVEKRDQDQYERIVARVYCRDTCINDALLQAGLAWHYKRHSNDPTMAALEQEARAAGRGLWSQTNPHPIPPWEWRRQRREPPRKSPRGASQTNLPPVAEDRQAFFRSAAVVWNRSRRFLSRRASDFRACVRSSPARCGFPLVA